MDLFEESSSDLDLSFFLRKNPILNVNLEGTWDSTFEKTLISKSKNKNKNKKIFHIKKEPKEKKVLNLKEIRKRARENAQDNQVLHDRTATDNILRKVQVNSLNSLRLFINKILQIEGYKEEFKDINYEYKKRITKDYLDVMKKRKIGDILSQEISGKFHNVDKKANSTVYIKVTNNIRIKNILSESYLKFVRDIYLNDNNKVNYYGSIITVENFKYFLEQSNVNNKQINDKSNKEYREKIKNVVRKFYKAKILFKQEKLV